MLNNRYFIAGCIVLMLVASALTYNQLPDQIPNRWNFNGEVISTMSKPLAVILLPVIAVLVSLKRYLAPRVDPRRESYSLFEQTYNRMTGAIVLFLAAMHVLLLTNFGNTQIVPRIVAGAVAAVIVVIGNEMGRVRPNWFIGIRTPWTLSSDDIWRQTHRLGGRLFFAVGLLNILSVLVLPLGTALPLLVITLVAVGPLLWFYSYLLWRQARVPLS